MRIPLLHPDAMTPEQRRVYDRVVAGSRGKIVGPMKAVLHSPELADRWHQLGEFFRNETSLPPRLSELAIVTTARYWSSDVAWQVHSEQARMAGIAASVIEAIRMAEAPEFRDGDESAVYEFVRELLTEGRVSDAVYANAHARVRTVALVELTAVVGYYSMAALMLSAHEIPSLAVPPGPPLQATPRALAPGRLRATRQPGD